MNFLVHLRKKKEKEKISKLNSRKIGTILKLQRCCLLSAASLGSATGIDLRAYEPLLELVRGHSTEDQRNQAASRSRKSPVWFRTKLEASMAAPTSEASSPWTEVSVRCLSRAAGSCLAQCSLDTSRGVDSTSRRRRFPPAIWRSNPRRVPPFHSWRDGSAGAWRPFHRHRSFLTRQCFPFSMLSWSFLDDWNEKNKGKIRKVLKIFPKFFHIQFFRKTFTF